MQHLHFILRG